MPSRQFCHLLWFATFVLSADVGWSQEMPASLPKLPQDPATIIAMVGESPILLGEVQPKAEARIKEVLAASGQEVPPDQLEIARANLVRGLLAQMIQSKMMRESFLLDQVGSQPANKRDEAREMMASRARQMFMESEVVQLKKKHQVSDLTALDEKLREAGTSLAERRRDFVDAMLGHMYVRSKIERDPVISLAEIMAYYEAHQEDYRHRDKARWEQLTVLFSRFGSKDEAHAAISAMGREAYFGGNMQAVARAQSQEPFAEQGGLHEWTNRGALASKVLDQQIFSLPLNAMSQIIEDEQGYHIIRILDRKSAGVAPLSEVQDKIREILKQQKIAKDEAAAMAAMRERVPVWSIFPDDIPGAKPLPPIATGPRSQLLR